MNKLISKILKNTHILILVLIIYFSIMVLNKLNILEFILTLLSVLSPLFIGIVVSWLLRPIVEYLEIKGLNRIFSLVLIYLILIFLIYIVIINCVPKFINELDEFINIFPSILDNINIKFIDMQSIKEDLFCFINDITKDIPKRCISLIGGLSSILLGFVIAFYLLISNIDLSNYFKRDTKKLLMKINDLLRGYVKGTLLSSFIIFILSTIVFYIIGIKEALLFGIICGITDVIPIIGPYIGALLPVVVSFIKSITYGLLVSVLILIIQSIEGNVLQPIIMSKSVNIHPVTTIVSLLVFGHFFGIIGMIIAVPVICILKEVYFYFKKKYNKYI
ncbi:MAG: AI-2E family transporter [Bacilli bacterium]|nr:AI-2E family transporter [Bacilli bacterium]